LNLFGWIRNSGSQPIQLLHSNSSTSKKGAKEKQKHQVYKGRARFTNPESTLNSLGQRDVSVSVIRHLLNGGVVHNDFVLDGSFRNFSHPSNEFEPHPLLLTMTSYIPSTTISSCFPRTFIYHKSKKLKRE